MDKNSKYVLVVIMILAILYLLYKNSSESYSSCNVKPSMMEHNDNMEEKIEHNDNMEEKIEHNSSKKLVVHHTTWCGYSRTHLQQMKNGLEKKLNDVGVTVEYVDCDKNPEKCVSAGVRGYPTLILYTDKGSVKYNGNRSEQDLLTFVQKH
jgi:hypothetical protein